MSSLLLVSGCLMVLAPAASPVAPVPQEAYVNRDQTAVRSGPGHEYYATDHLDRGSRVEVYRRDEDGWLAVRPPLDSYSLIPARQLEPTATKDVARVRDSGAVAWVATRHGPVSNYKWQVKLDVGELVRVLGQEDVTLFDGAERETAYRVAPPSGEFRWIHEEFLSAAPPSNLAANLTTPAGQPSVELADYRIVVESQDAASPQSTLSASTGTGGPSDTLQSGAGQSWRAARRTSVPPASTASTFGPTTASIIGSTIAPGTADPATRMPTIGEPPPTTDALQELDVLLSLIVSQPPERWDLADLRARALAMIDNGQTALERGRARLLLEKITQFAELQQRHDQIGPTSGAANTDSIANRPAANSNTALANTGLANTGLANTGLANTGLANTGLANTGLANTQVVGGNILPLATAAQDPTVAPIGSGLAEPVDPSSYDALGLLVPVHSRTRKAPPYALVDDNGQVLKYVSPSPGLNLHRYLGKRVGILGQGGYLPTLEARHVTAQRVIQLDRHQR